jgi:predicted extracellular nuclease
MTAPDIVAMQEIQDNDGAELTDVTDASVTWQAIIDKIVELGGPKYAWVDRPPVANAEGGQPGGNIRNGFLYDPTRVTVKSVSRLEDPAFKGSRVPLQVTFEFKHGAESEEVKLMSVHNTSKRGRGDAAAEIQVPQAAAINAWAKTNAPAGPYQHLGVFGDRNAYTHESPMQKEIEGGALELLSLQLPKEEQYSAQFGGSSGELDHASAKTSVPVAIDLVHMNSDFDERFRASDHDGTLTAWDFRRGKA